MTNTIFSKGPSETLQQEFLNNSGPFERKVLKGAIRVFHEFVILFFKQSELRVP
jgi:hypothetical protein